MDGTIMAERVTYKGTASYVEKAMRLKSLPHDREGLRFKVQSWYDPQ